jgi:SAM-dependent methyltransferase
MAGFELGKIPNIVVGDFINSRCIACSFVGPLTKITIPGEPSANGGYYEYSHCPECGTISLITLLDRSDSYYPDDYHSFSRNTLSPIRQMVRNISNRIALYDNTPFATISAALCPFTAFLSLRPLFDGSLGRKYSAKSALLDVGCGDGQKLLDLRNIGFSNLTGVDPYIRNSSGPPGVHLSRGGISDVTDSFDIVTFHHSFEHIDSPEETLELLHRIVRSDGVAVIRIPLIGGWAWRTYGGEWAQLDAPRHLHLCSRGGFETLAKRMGWNVVRTIYDSGWLQFTGSALNYREGKSIQEVQKTFTSKQRKDFQKKAQELNQNSDGDQATFFLFHSRTPA